MFKVILDEKIIKYIAFFYLTGLTTTSGLPVVAGDCNSRINKKAEIKCTEGDTKCKNEKAEKLELNKTVRS
mgnify:CR=1 FL=1